MRTYPGVKLSVFKDPAEREQIKILDDMTRQISGGLSRSIQSGQSPAANPVPSLSNPTGPPPSTGTPIAALGDLLFGLDNGAWAKLPIGANGSLLNVIDGVPAWSSGASLGALTVTSLVVNGPTTFNGQATYNHDTIDKPFVIETVPGTDFFEDPVTFLEIKDVTTGNAVRFQIDPGGFTANHLYTIPDGLPIDNRFIDLDTYIVSSSDESATGRFRADNIQPGFNRNAFFPNSDGLMMLVEDVLTYDDDLVIHDGDVVTYA